MPKQLRNYLLKHLTSVLLYQIIAHEHDFQMFKDLTKEVPPIMNVLNIHENLLEALLEMGNYADVQGWDSMLML